MRDRLLFAEAAARLAIAAVSSRLLPVRRLLRTPRLRYAAATGVDPAPRVVRAVERAARVVPGATCLPQAIATRSLLAGYGIASDLKLGVQRTEEGLRAHAWLEREGQVVIGGSESRERFAPLGDLDARF